jgi:acetoin utilization deacetylase AcuC-like enzyme
MYVIYHHDYEDVYSGDPAAEAGRMEAIYEEVGKSYPIIQAVPASKTDILLVHTEKHIAWVERIGLYYISSLAAGGAIKAAEYSLMNEPSFALIRPPGHHASPNSSWGFCYFNNIAIAVQRIRMSSNVDKVLIIDFDLHYGDGTHNIFKESTEVTYFHIPNLTREEQLRALSDYLDSWRNIDLLAVSAGFDRHVEDWGGSLSTNDYLELGRILRDFSIDRGYNRRFAVLEGGYNHKVLGKNVKAFLNGFK